MARRDLHRPEFGTVTRADLTAVAREALDARFDALIACGFNFDAHTSELTKLGPLPILKAKMNPDLHMSEELKNTGAGILFIVFGEPDIEWRFNDEGEIIVEVLGVDVFDPKTGEVRASDKDDIAAWFIDTTITRKASSSATPISWARTIRTSRSKPALQPISTEKPGKRSIATFPSRSRVRRQGASPSRSLTILAMR